MVQQLKLCISEKGKVIDTIIKETDTAPSVLYKSVDDFRLLANAAITQLIEKSESGAQDEYNEEDTSSENDEEVVCSNAKRRKKSV
ncbi:unnamed protein product, partial [Iphiclides podalirius]